MAETVFNQGSPYGAGENTLEKAKARLSQLEVERETNKAIVEASTVSRSSKRYKTAASRLREIDSEISDVKKQITDFRNSAKREKDAEKAAQEARGRQWLAEQEAAGAQRVSGYASKAEEQAKRAEDAGDVQRAAALRQQAAGFREAAQAPSALSSMVTAASTAAVGTKTPAQQALAGRSQTITYPANFNPYEAVLIRHASGYEKGKGPLLSYGNQYVNKAEAQQLLYTMGDEERKRLSAFAQTMGVAESTAWNVAIEAAAAKLMHGTNVTPLEALDQYVQQGIDAGQFSRGGAKTTSWTNRQLQLTNADDARVIIDSALSQYLGRNATEKERKAFLTALNAQEQAKPTIQKGTTTTGVGGSTSQTSKTTGGFSDAARAQFAEDWARAQEGAAEHEFANRGVKLLLDGLAPIVKLGGV